MRPFPLHIADPEERAKHWRRYREDMLAQARFAVFIAGNKRDPDTGEPIRADGVWQEFEIARAQGVYCIPVGATGWVAAEIWKQMQADPAGQFEGADISAELAVLGDPVHSDAELIGAVIRIVDRTSRALTRRLIASP
jgi:hypothetical protein